MGPLFEDSLREEVLCVKLAESEALTVIEGWLL
jgi:hypothetical protein